MKTAKIFTSFLLAILLIFSLASAFSTHSTSLTKQYADIELTNIILTPKEPIQGGSLEVDAKIRNLGNIPTVYGARLRIMDPEGNIFGQVLLFDPERIIEPNEEVMINFNDISNLIQGTYKLEVTAMSEEEDHNPRNNQKSKEVYVSESDTIPLYECGILDIEGATYELQNDILLGFNEECFQITSNHITLNLKGYSIIGPGDYAIILDEPLESVTIQNGVIEGPFHDGIRIDDGLNHIIMDVSIRNVNTGIEIGEARDILIEDNHIEDMYIGILLNDQTRDIQVVNNKISEMWEGGIIVSEESEDILIKDNEVYNEAGRSYGIGSDEGSNNIFIENNEVYGIEYGVVLGAGAVKYIVRDNRVYDNTYGIGFGEGSTNHLIYNNFFNNSNDYVGNAQFNFWNTAQQEGPNIIGGPFIGGNYWANPDGTGFSQTCEDSDSNGFCDDSYALGENNIDYLPLAMGQQSTDLAVTSMMLNPEEPDLGDVVNVTITVENLGNVTALAIIGIRGGYYGEGHGAGWGSAPIEVVLEPNEVWVREQQINAFDPGTYDMSVNVESEIPDINQDNNEMSVSFVV